mmetsp:Transcript_25532/g.100838  ORF Transcript_25532/g.100838 Transcript_25532/m.100838 type:complete len:136 (-) Transcript_25532:271-678(-)
MIANRCRFPMTEIPVHWVVCTLRVELTWLIFDATGVLDLGIRQLSIWPKPTPESELKTDGIYAQVRHPIYSGVLVSTLGYAVATGSPARIALAGALAYFFTRKIQVEEDFLEEKFGDDYADYRQNVPFKLFPKLF